MCVTKASLAIAVGIMFLILQAIGYVPRAGNANAPEAIRNLELCFILIPAALPAAGVLVILSGARLRRSAGVPNTLAPQGPGFCFTTPIRTRPPPFLQWRGTAPPPF